MRQLSISHEDVDRAADRGRVARARLRTGWSSRLRLLWLLVGPGILVMLGENDGPSMLSYASTGSSYGIGFFLPFIVLTFLMAVVVQEMTVRLASATQRGHAELIFDRFGPFWGWFSAIDLAVGNFLTLITEFIAVRAGMSYFGVPAWLAICAALAILSLALLTHRYWTWERVTLAGALLNLLFVPVALLAHPNWHAVGHALFTWRPLPSGSSQQTLLILLSDIGATVTPWMLFFQQSATVDKGLTRRDLGFGRLDTVAGAALAACGALAAVIATAPLYARHLNLASLREAQFAQALRPVVGSAGAALFALGLTEAGIVACITISISSAYAFGEVARRPHSLNLPLREGKAFYGVLFFCALAAAAIVLIPGLPLVYVVLIVNVIAVLAMPPALLFLYLLANDREIMGDLVSPPLANVVTGLVVLVLVAAGVLFGLSIIAPHFFVRVFGHLLPG